MHQPVLLNEVIKFLDPQPGEFIIDGTINGGGHAAAILEKIGPKGKLLGVDWDKEIISKARAKFADRQNVIAIHGNYADLPEILRKLRRPVVVGVPTEASGKRFGKADGLLLDLGFSSEQLTDTDRGFSFMRDEQLLMTYDGDLKPVKQILKELSAKDLAKIIFELSGEKFAMRIAQTIKERGRRKPVETSLELAEIIREALPKNYERGRIDPATRTFQALRIYANKELDNLHKVLGSLGEILNPGGRAAIISFHSLEDRIVKQCFRELERNGQIQILTKKPITPSSGEIRENPRSRSAKLRAAIII